MITDQLNFPVAVVPGENKMMGMLSRMVTTVIWLDLFEIKRRIKKTYMVLDQLMVTFIVFLRRKHCILMHYGSIFY